MNGIERPSKDPEHVSFEERIRQHDKEITTLMEQVSKLIESMGQSAQNLEGYFRDFLNDNSKWRTEFVKDITDQLKTVDGAIRAKETVETALSSIMRDTQGELLKSREQSERYAQEYREVSYRMRDIKEFLDKYNLPRIKEGVDSIHRWKDEHERKTHAEIEERLDSLASKSGRVALGAWRILIVALLGTALSVGGGLVGASIQRDIQKREAVKPSEPQQLAPDETGGNF